MSGRWKEKVVYAKLEDLTPENGWTKLCGSLKRYRGELPELDDLTARCVNRMGGWTTLFRQYQAGTFLDRKADFADAWKSFIGGKISGHYNSDNLPRISGLYEERTAYRVVIKEDTKKCS